MMKRLIIICEGPTENEFCLHVLAPALLKKGIFVDAPLIKKSNGGIVPWGSIKRQIENHLHEKDAYVSMLIDYYGIKDSYNFPGWMESKTIENLEERMSFLWDKMYTDVSPDLANRFIPYIQLHEFESLLFSDIEVFENNFDRKELNIGLLQAAVQKFSNPEEINSRPTLAPSKRLMAAVEGYEKIIYGSCLAEEIGLEKIISMCPLFRGWFNRLSSL